MDAERSFDGLPRVASRRFALAWVREGVAFSVYQKLLILPSELAYKKKPERGLGARENFELTPSQDRRLRESLHETLAKRLLEAGWTQADAPGPDVLVLRASLIDLVVNVPPQRSGRGRTYVSSYGEATLVVEFFDSQTRQILARIADRKAAEPSGNRMGIDIEAASEVRRMFDSWAERVRDALDEVRAGQS